MGRKSIDLTNQKFGKLTVIKRMGYSKYGSALWLCKCDCGNERIAKANDLKRKRKTKVSCGCTVGGVIDNSNLFIMNGKMFKNNTSGHKGIYYDKEKSKWRASIGYKKKVYSLFRSDDINDCIYIRKMAEEAINNGCFESFYCELKSK